MQSLGTAELERQTILELPARNLMGAWIWVSGSIDVDILTTILNHSFRNWHISILNDNSVQITVDDNLTGTEVTTFCNETVSAMAVNCTGQIT